MGQNAKGRGLRGKAGEDQSQQGSFTFREGSDSSEKISALNRNINQIQEINGIKVVSSRRRNDILRKILGVRKLSNVERRAGDKEAFRIINTAGIELVGADYIRYLIGSANRVSNSVAAAAISNGFRRGRFKVKTSVERQVFANRAAQLALVGR